MFVTHCAILAMKGETGMNGVNKKCEFTQNEFQKAAEAGAFSRVVVRAGWSHFSIFGQMRGGGEAFLVATRQKRAPREFRNPAAALVLLRQIGVTKAEVEMANGMWRWLRFRCGCGRM
jgi:hypothetical protein